MYAIIFQKIKKYALNYAAEYFKIRKNLYDVFLKSV